MTLTPTTRASLLFRLRDAHDHEAWVEFVSLYEPVVYRLLRRHGLQDADARDVMQELFLAVSRSIDRWDPAKERGSFRGWLRRVARNLVINWLKQPQRRTTATGGSDLAGDAGQAARQLWPGDGRVRSGVASRPVSAGGRTSARGSPAGDLAGVLGNRCRRNFSRRRCREAGNDGRGGSGRQVPRLGSAASGSG